MFSRLLSLLLFFLTLLILQASFAIEFTVEEKIFLAENPVIRVGGEMGWPPMEYVENNEYTGAALDFLKEIEASTGIEFDVVTGYSWGDLMSLIRAHDIDMLPMMFWTDVRGREFRMTLPYITIRHYVYMKGENAGIKEMEDLAGMTIAIPTGYASIDIISKDHPDITILEVPGVVDAIDAVLTGNADAVIENSASMAYFSSTQSIVGLAPVFKVRFESNNMGMAVRSDWPVLRDILQKALNEISKERVTSIMANWTGSESVAKTFLTLEAEFTPAESSFLKAQSPVTACVNVNRMPMETVSEGSPSGMNSDYLAALGATMKVQFRVQGYQSASDILTALSNGECDLATLSLSAGVTYTNTLQLSEYISAKLALVSGSSNAFIDDLRDLPATTLGYVDGYIDIETLRDRYSNIEFVPFATIDDALEEVASQRLFGVIDNMPSVNYALQKRLAAELKISGIFENETVRFGIATTASKPMLASAIEKAVLAMPEALNANVQRKWIAVSIEKETDLTWFWRSVAVAVGILLLVIMRFVELRKHREEIQQKNLTLREINTKLEQQTDSALHMAYHDPLTGLPNRANLMQELERAIELSNRNSTSLAVLFIDLDRFKPVNDTLGHAIGDQLLKKVAEVIQELLRESDSLSRIGGDEFVVVLRSLSDSYSPSVVAQRIIDMLGHTFTINQHDINIGCSIGIALLNDDAEELHAIIKCADSAMYTAKENGRNRFAYYREEMSKKAVRRTQIEAALRHSIKEQGFSLVFQPIVDLERGEVVKAEALIRWNHAELGFVPPDEFIPIAEDVGIIVEIGDRVLHRACQAMRDFMDQGVDVGSIAVNVSSVEFTKSDVTSRFQKVLERYDIRPEQIEIEITERHMLDPTQGAETELLRLRELGHTICVDDFGTGYSSLSYMKQLPINVIKIDRSFIGDIPHDQNDVAITQAIISLSHNLGYKVVAEGVETKEQLDYLVTKCCNYAQGYYLSRPVVAEEFAAAAEDIKARLNVKPEGTARLRILRI